MVVFAIALFGFGVCCTVLGLMPAKAKPPTAPSVPKVETAAPVKREPNKLPNPTKDEEYAYIYTRVDIYIPEDNETVFATLKFDEPLFLETEPDNPYDDKAIKVVQDGQTLGYLYKGKLQDMVNDYLRDYMRVDAELNRYNETEREISIDLSFAYRSNRK